MGLQQWIHQVEIGGGLKPLRYVLVTLALIGLFVSYNYRGFKNMSNPEAMDMAQVARNIATGKGYTTLFIRPLSIHLLRKEYERSTGHAPPLYDEDDVDRLAAPHPDLCNPPVYPTVLAGLMRIFPSIQHMDAGVKSLWNRNGGFWVYGPDFLISVFNQVLFVLSIALLFFMALRLFDRWVAWTSAAMFLGTDLFWRFSISGLSTMLVILIFIGLAWCLLLIEQRSREPEGGMVEMLALAAGAGLLLGIGMLTRYSFGVLLLPVLAYLILFLGRQRVASAVVALAVFVAVVTPWIARNYHISHTPFGIAGYSVYETTPFFDGFILQRSLDPDFGEVHYNQVWSKMTANLRTIVQNDLPTLGGNWVTAFFLAGLLMPFRNKSLGRLRWFALFCIPALAVAQALGRTHLSDLSDQAVAGVTSENQLIIVMPLVLMFGTSFFFTLLDQLDLPVRELRYVVMAGFFVLSCLPMILTFVTSRVQAVAYPPYYPPVIQRLSRWMKPEELMMSDVPWAVAWYGERRCLWLTLSVQSFYDLHDFAKQPVNGLYITLSPEMLDSRVLSQWVRASEASWDRFVIECVMRRELPAFFPLRKMPAGFLPEQLFLSDTVRWIEPAPQ
jgi:4-amino-4-deoxy-L-arabinose transferase-like glycosyltransferase